MWGFIRGFLVLVAVLAVFTIGEMMLDAQDENASAVDPVQIVSR